MKNEKEKKRDKKMEGKPQGLLFTKIRAEKAILVNIMCRTFLA